MYVPETKSMPAGLQSELMSRFTEGCQKSLRVSRDIEKCFVLIRVYRFIASWILDIIFR